MGLLDDHLARQSAASPCGYELSRPVDWESQAEVCRDAVAHLRERGIPEQWLWSRTVEQTHEQHLFKGHVTRVVTSLTAVGTGWPIWSSRCEVCRPEDAPHVNEGPWYFLLSATERLAPAAFHTVQSGSRSGGSTAGGTSRTEEVVRGRLATRALRAESRPAAVAGRRPGTLGLSRP